ncbi:hypothetical protein VQL36_02825 [Chengkuizengella sp. SCS-71B]
MKSEINVTIDFKLYVHIINAGYLRLINKIKGFVLEKLRGIML